MTAKEMDFMYNTMRINGVAKQNRSDLDMMVFAISRGLYAIGRTELAAQLENLYEEMEDVPTDDLMELGTFK